MEKGWSLTVCLIVKNEGHCLGECLSSIKAWADQIVVVDTGSTDNTVEVAACYGAQVEYFSWEDDFAAARNYGLQFAVGDWILVLDADEYIDGNLEMLSDLVTKDYEGYYLTIKSPLGIGELEAEDHVVRLFRNGRGYIFRGAIHEQIASCIKDHNGQEAIGFSSIIVRHRGYTPEEISRKKKGMRNSRIIKGQLAKRQEDTFMLYSLGIELVQQAQYGEAGELAMKALRQMTGEEGYFREVLLLALMASIKKGNYGEVEDLFVKALAMMPEDSDIVFLAGLRQTLLGDYHCAKELFLKGGCNTVLLPAHLINAIIGELFFRQGFWLEAVGYLKQSLEEAPSLYTVVKMVEIMKQGQISLDKVLADAMDGNFIRLAHEAVQKEDYYAAAVVCLAAVAKDINQNFEQCKTLYQLSIKQAGSMPAIVKECLDIMYQQMEICKDVLVIDKKCLIAHSYLAKAVNKSLDMWLALWPEHGVINIWECCL